MADAWKLNEGWLMGVHNLKVTTVEQFLQNIKQHDLNMIEISYQQMQGIWPPMSGKLADHLDHQWHVAGGARW